MNKHFEDQWKALKQVKPTNHEKEMIQKRILKSIQESPTSRSQNWSFQWKSILATCVLFLVLGYFLFIFYNENNEKQMANKMNIENVQFSWELENVYGKKTENGLNLHLIDQQLQVGKVHQVTKAEMNQMVNHSPMYVRKELKKFPYQTMMYIEHVKMIDVQLRYHFFIPIMKGQFMHIEFDYPKLDHSEIYNAIATIKIKGMDPYQHDETLYVQHGYSNLIYPVGLKPMSISTSKQVYRWNDGSSLDLQAYLRIIEEANWNKKETKNDSYIFISKDGNEEVTIKMEGNTIIYEFNYPNREE